MSQSIPDSVYTLVNSCQSSAHVHIRTAKRIWTLHQNHPEVVSQILLACVEHAVAFTTAQVDRFLRFMGAFAQSLPPEQQNQAKTLIESIVSALLPHLEVECKTERLRACTALAAILHHLTTDMCLSERLINDSSTAIYKRLDDKCPKVRAEAVLALSYLSHVDTRHQELRAVSNALCRLMSVEKNQVVRRVIIRSLTPARNTAELLIKHSKDESVEVRRAVYTVCRMQNFSDVLSVGERMRLVTVGTQDLAEGVQQACSTMVAGWYEDVCGGNILQLLDYMGAVRQSGAALRIVQLLMASGCLNLLELMANPPVVSLKEQHSEVLPGSVCCFWRALCEAALQRSKELQTASLNAAGTQAEHAAAEARQFHDAVEDMVPDAEDMFNLIRLHVAAGPPQRPAALHLLSITNQTVEFSDGSVRVLSASLLQDLVLHDPWLPETTDTHDEGVGHEDTPVAGQGTHTWERAVCDFAMKAFPEQHLFAEEMVQNLKLACDAWGVLSPVDSEGAESQRTRVQQALVWLCCMVQCLKDVKYFAIEDISLVIRQGLISPHPDARSQAMCAIASWCMLSGAPSSAAFEECCIKVLEGLQDEDTHVQQMAVRAVSNIIVSHGVSALDSACGKVRMEEGLLESVNSGGASPPTASGMLLGLLKQSSLKAEKLPQLRGKGHTRRQESRNLSEGDARLAVAVVTGLQRVLMCQYQGPQREAPEPSQDVDEQVVMLALLLLKWDALPSAVTEIQHINQSFWNVYASCAPANQLKLCRVFIPALTVAVQQPATKATMAAEVTLFIAGLLAHEPKDDIGGQADCPLSAGVEDLLMDLLCLLVFYTQSDADMKARLKPLAASTLKALLMLPWHYCAPSSAGKVRGMVDYVREHLRERTLAKDISQLVGTVGHLPCQDGDKMEPHEVEALVDQRFQLQHMNDLWKAATAEHPEGRLQQTARPAQRQRRRAQALESSSEEDEPAVLIRAPAQAPQAHPAPLRRSMRAAAHTAMSKLHSSMVIKVEESDGSDKSDESDSDGGSLSSDEE